MRADQWWEKNGHTVQTEYEALFFRAVLGKLPGFDFSGLHAQGKVDAPTSGAKESSTPYYTVDFLIIEGNARIAIEIEGWDKTGTGSGADYQRFKYELERGGNINAAGNRLLAFSNAHVKRHPEECRRVLMLVLNQERAKGRAVGSDERRELEAQRTELEALDRARRAELEAAWAKFEAERASGEEEAEKALNRAQAELARAEQIREALGDIGRTRFTARVAMAIAVAAIVIVSVGVVVVMAGGDSGSGLSTGENCDSALQWDVADDHVGERVAVEGPVVSTHYAKGSRGRPTYLNIGEAFRPGSSDRLTAIIWGDDRSRFPEPPERLYADARVCIRGEITLYRGAPQIEVESPAEIVVTG